jgi:hypothetical protein
MATITLPKLREMMDYLFLIKNASFDDPIAKMMQETLRRIRNPPQGPIVIENAGARHSIAAYLALEHSSQSSYKRIIDST